MATKKKRTGAAGEFGGMRPEPVPSPEVETAEQFVSPQMMVALKSLDSGIDIDKVASAMIAQLGGSERVGALIAAEFLNAPQKSLVRSRSLDMIVRMLSKVCDRVKPRSAEDMSDDELAAESADILAERRRRDGQEEAP